MIAFTRFSINQIVQNNYLNPTKEMREPMAIPALSMIEMRNPPYSFSLFFSLEWKLELDAMLNSPPVNPTKKELIMITEELAQKSSSLSSKAIINELAIINPLERQVKT